MQHKQLRTLRHTLGNESKSKIRVAFDFKLKSGIRKHVLINLQSARTHYPFHSKGQTCFSASPHAGMGRRHTTSLANTGFFAKRGGPGKFGGLWN